MCKSISIYTIHTNITRSKTFCPIPSLPRGSTTSKPPDWLAPQPCPRASHIGQYILKLQENLSIFKPYFCIFFLEMCCFFHKKMLKSLKKMKYVEEEVLNEESMNESKTRAWDWTSCCESPARHPTSWGIEWQSGQCRRYSPPNTMCSLKFKVPKETRSFFFGFKLLTSMS